MKMASGEGSSAHIVDNIGGGAALVGSPDVACATGSPKVTRRQMVVNLIAGGLGTGMFSLPWSMAGASVIPGLAMTVGVVALNAWTIMILVEAAEAKQVFDLGGLMGLLPGRLPGRLGRRLPSVGGFMQSFTNFMVWIVLLGSVTSYLIVMHDSARPFVANTFLDEGREPLVTLAALVVLPLCFLDQRFLSWTSSVAFLVNVYLIGILCSIFAQKTADDDMPHDVCFFGLGKGSVAMLAALAQCVIIQMCVLPMYEELEDRSPQEFKKALYTAFGILTVTFGGFATVGYLTFGAADITRTAGNVLVNLPRNSFANAAQIGTIAVVAAIYPIMVIPMIAPIKNMMPTDPTVNRWRRCIAAGAVFAIVAISYLGAIVVPDLRIVNVVDGALCVGAFTAIGPSLAGLYLLDRPSRCWKILMVVLLIFGLSNAVLGIVFNENYTDELAENCAWAAHKAVVA